MDAGIDEGEQAVDYFDAWRRIIAGKGIGAQQHRGTADFFRKRFTHAGGMRLDQLGLEQLDMLDLDARVFQQPDAGIEAIHHRRFIMHPGRFDIVATLLQRFAWRWCKHDFHVRVAGDGDDLLRSQGRAIEGDVSHGESLRQEEGEKNAR